MNELQTKQEDADERPFPYAPSEAYLIRAFDIGHVVKSNHYPEELELRSGDSAGFDPFLQSNHAIVGFHLDSNSAPELYADTKGGPGAVERLEASEIESLAAKVRGQTLGPMQVHQVSGFFKAGPGSTLMMYNNRRNIYVLGELDSGINWKTLSEVGFPAWLWHSDDPGTQTEKVLLPMRGVTWRLCGNLKDIRRSSSSTGTDVQGAQRLGFTFK